MNRKRSAKCMYIKRQTEKLLRLANIDRVGNVENAEFNPSIRGSGSETSAINDDVFSVESDIDCSSNANSSSSESINQDHSSCCKYDNSSCRLQFDQSSC
uniref:Putative secreted protein n=1 Tax=Xenopsylla cheopis TaxID=163159 RepID=A0A6M2DV50_XENCH